MKLIFLAVIIAALLAGCGGSDDANTTTTTTTSTTTTLPGQAFTPLQRRYTYDYSDFTIAPKVIALRSAAEFSNYWIDKNPPPTGQAVPEVDFTANFALSVEDKVEPSVGYVISIARIEPTVAGVTVHATQLIPGSGCLQYPLLCRPYHLVTTPIFSGDITLNVSQQTIDCPRQDYMMSLYY